MVATVLQQPFLFSRSIRDNLALAAPEADDHAVVAAARDAALHASIDRLVATGAVAVFLTQYGRVTGLAALAGQLHEQIDELVALTRAAPGDGQARHDWLKQAVEASLMNRLRAHGCTLDDAVCKDLLANDVELNTQGLLVWRDRG